MRIPLISSLKKYTNRKVGLPPGTLVYVGEERTDPVQISVFNYNETLFDENIVQTVEACLPYRNDDTVLWIHAEGIHDAEIIEEIGVHFGVNSLVLEDLMTSTQLPKIEVHDKYVFIILKSIGYPTTSLDISKEQISLIIGENFLISLQEEPGDLFASVKDRLRNKMGRIRQMGVDYLLCALIDIIVDNYFIIIDQLNDRIEAVEEQAITNPTPEVLTEINSLRREFLFLRRPILPLRDVLEETVKGEIQFITQDTHLYFQDVYDHLEQVIHTIETLRIAVSELFNTYTSAISHRMNEVMKVLTVVATFFIPLTFITGIYGMNFKFMPELDSLWGYPVVLLAMLTISIGMFIYFKLKKWL
ncbi:magnesium/cobalt transporter CorA [Candidatus Poribacteria bacterium]|nr:magnesium/cobalt transporter CorA [Candidatus Poribacteria bacterium]